MVCELDLIFNFHKEYVILDEILFAGELQESNKKTVARLIATQKVSEIFTSPDEKNKKLSLFVLIINVSVEPGRGWKVVSVHGDNSQHDRTKAMSLFKDGKCHLMIVIDVASRGLDILGAEVVSNYSFPLTAEDYIHRIGRTGRAGKKRVAHTFFTLENKALAQLLGN
ncbi:hypothetical protein J5N97_001402 [Dioscorea zingiberensis]|uniref:Helicase C-terminal domain-containing protein n=1 Tax=Dioscorea zingiberensis TaxID=325984 RepID=A0A9D5H2D7_9LILI|nr:hypothetical protein J5N97_001402 [Dioscorea zingiberensis]